MLARLSPTSLLASWTAALAVVLSLVATPPARAQIPDRDALAGLVERIDMPWTRELFGILMQGLAEAGPDLVMRGMGQRLGPDWKAGNAHYDTVRAELVAANAREEQRNGPIYVVDTPAMLASFRASWSPEEIRFLTEQAATPLGKAMMAWTDLMIISGATGKADNFRLLPPTHVRRLEDLRQRARGAFGDASVKLSEERKKNEASYQRIDRLLQSVSGPEAEKLGRLAVQGSIKRQAAVLFDIMPKVRTEIDAFMAERAPATPAGAPPAEARNTP